jgi:peroxiredoxin
MIQPGEVLPDSSFFIVGADGPEKLEGHQLFTGKTVVVVGLPGAFTPTCDQKHLPGFISKHEELRAKGVDQIAVVSVNDHWVMQTWQQRIDPAGSILFLGDGNAEFAAATGLGEDMSEVGYGTRLRRFALVVRDGKVVHLAVEDHRGQVDGSSVEAVLATL